MNERIKAIGRQAGFAFIEDGIYGQRWYSSKCGMDASEFEKFAELIVRECAKKCEFIAVQAEITNTGEMARKTKATADSCAKMIKQHFGVEE